MTGQIRFTVYKTQRLTGDRRPVSQFTTTSNSSSSLSAISLLSLTPSWGFQYYEGVAILHETHSWTPIQLSALYASSTYLERMEEGCSIVPSRLQFVCHQLTG